MKETRYNYVIRDADGEPLHDKRGTIQTFPFPCHVERVKYIDCCESGLRGRYYVVFVEHDNYPHCLMYPTKEARNYAYLLARMVWEFHCGGV